MKTSKLFKKESLLNYRTATLSDLKDKKEIYKSLNMTSTKIMCKVEILSFDSLFVNTKSCLWVESLPINELYTIVK